MSDKQKVPFEQMAFYYEKFVTDALDNLFSQVEDHGWTREEFDKMYYMELAQNALQEKEPVLH